MQCPKCRAENREGSRFCAECGASLASACPDCGFANYPGAKFCSDCGRALSATTVSSTDSALEREAPEAERRQLTVMFCDLVGSTALAERLDPEELRDLLAQYQQTCADVIQHFDGHIARYVGDGLLVYFGYPQAHEDDAQRGVRAGLGIVEAIRDLDPKFANPDVSLAVRIGITTGLVVAGDIGSGERFEEKAIVGETPNLAARLQALAEPNTIVIGVGTHRLVEGLFDCDDLGPQALKGISETVVAYRARQESGVPSRFEASAIRGLTPLVGRESEIGLLLNRWAHAKEGEGQAVLFSGEAGIGKSRIVRAFRDHVEAGPHNRVLYYGSPYHQNSALYPAIEQLERGLRFEKDDSAARKFDKLDAVLGDLGLPVAEYAPVLASLLSVPADGRYPPLELGPAQLKKKTLNAIVTMIQAMSSQRPVLMVVEDVHWIDPSTLELVSLLIEQLQANRVFLLMTCRLEFVPPWGSQAHITSLTLNRLSHKESAAMIGNVTAGKALPKEVLEQIVAKTDGVPLFVEELTKNVLELLEDAGDRYQLSGSLPPLAIPASLQDSLMARLDRLAPVKEVAQLAATLGRRFSHELLAAVSPLAEKELQDALAQLAEAELIYRRGLPSDLTYEFKHALVRDVAYRSLLKSTRAQFHERIAVVLEAHFPQTAETEPEILAHHFEAAGLAEKAIVYWRRAGELAAQRSANVEAISHFTKALKQLESLPESAERDKQELALQIGLGPALAATKGPASPEISQTYERARVLCEQLGESQRFPVVWGLWFAKNQTGQITEACALADELLAIGQQQADTGVLLEAHHSAWTSHFAGGELRDVLAQTKEGKALYDIDQHRSHALLYGGHDPGVCCRFMGAMTLCLLGFPDQGRDWIRDAVALAEKLGHQPTLAIALSFTTTVYQFRREAQLVQEHAERLSALCAEHGFAFIMAMATIVRGWSLAAQGQTEEGIEQSSAGLDALRATGIRRLSFQLAIVAESYCWAGDTDKGLQAVDEALTVVNETGEERWAPEVYRLKGQLLLAKAAQDRAEAEVCFNRAIELSRKQEAKLFELRAATSLGRLWNDQGKRKEANELLAPIYSWFTQGFDTADLQEAEALLDELA